MIAGGRIATFSSVEWGAREPCAPQEKQKGPTDFSRPLILSIGAKFAKSSAGVLKSDDVSYGCYNNSYCFVTPVEQLGAGAVAHAGQFGVGQTGVQTVTGT